MDENFSPRVKDVISFSKEEALRLGHDVIGTEHLMLGIIREGEGSAVQILESLDVDMGQFRSKVEGISAPNFQKEPNNKRNLPLTRQAEKALKTTFLEAKLYQSNVIRTAHLLLCILRNDDDPVSRLLSNAGVDYEQVKEPTNKVSQTTCPTDPLANLLLERRTMNLKERRQFLRVQTKRREKIQNACIGKFWPRPDQIGSGKQARSCGRSGTGNRTRFSNPFAQKRTTRCS